MNMVIYNEGFLGIYGMVLKLELLIPGCFYIPFLQDVKGIGHLVALVFSVVLVVRVVRQEQRHQVFKMKRTFDITINTGIRIIVSVFIFLISFSLASAQELTLIDCISGSPISDVIVTQNEENRFLGISNQSGIVKWSNRDNLKLLHFKKLGSLDTIVAISKNQTSLCLIQKLTQLQIVEIEGKSIPLHKQFEKFIEKNKTLLSDEVDTLYYAFNYKMDVPETGGECEMSGVLMIPLTSPLKRIYSGGYSVEFCSLQIIVNPEFYNSPIFLDFMKTEAAQFFNYDPMRKGIYLRNIKQDMVVNKVIRGDSTQFYCQGYGFTKKHYFSSSPVFNKDSIIVWDEILYEQFDKPRENKNAEKLRQQESVLKYVLKERLYLNNLELKGVKSAWDWNYNAQYQMQ